VKRVYYGWYLVAAAAFIYVAIVGATFGAYGLYVLPVSAEWKLSRADVNTGLILMNLGNAALAPFMGRLLDRVPVRWVMIASTVVFGLSLATLSLSHSLWLNIAVLTVAVPTAYLGVGSLSATVFLARWFVANRGRAMALAGLGIFLGQIIVAPPLGYMIEHHGWRFALMASGGVLTLLLLPLGFIVRERPGPDDVEPGRATLAANVEDAAADKPASVGVILRTPAFWTVALGVSLGLAVSQTLVVTLVPLAREAGLSMMQATSLISVMGAGAIVTSLLLAVVADKIDRVLLLTVLFVIGALVNAALLSGHGYGLLLTCAAVLGALTAMVTPVFYALLADIFGARSFGTVRGLSFMALAVMAMIGIRFAGEVYDRTGAYQIVFHVGIATYLVAAALIFATRLTGRRAGAPAPARPTA
jgi:MFS family permease